MVSLPFDLIKNNDVIYKYLILKFFVKQIDPISNYCYTVIIKQIAVLKFLIILFKLFWPKNLKPRKYNDIAVRVYLFIYESLFWFLLNAYTPDMLLLSNKEPVPFVLLPHTLMLCILEVS